MIRTILLGLAGVAWSGVAFLGGIYLTFPGQAARDWIQWKVAESSNDEYAVEMSPVSLWWFPGVKAEDVTVYSVKKPRKTKGSEEEPPAYERTSVGHFDELAARVQLIPRIFGKWSYGFSAGFNGGDIDGHYANSDTVTELEFDSEGIDLALTPIVNDTVTLNLLGKIDAECDLVVDKEELNSSTGSLKIDIPGFGIAEGSSVVGIGLDPVNFSKATVSFEAKDGKLEVTEGVFTSDTVNATLSGDITLNKKLARSRYRLELAFTLPESLDKMVGLAPDMKKSRDKDGNYHVMVSGNLLSPKFRAGKGTGKPGKLLDGGGLGDAGADEEGGSAGSTDEAREERRKRREERIKERRERMRQRREDARARGDNTDGPPGSGEEEIVRDPRGGDDPNPINYDDEIPPPPNEPPDNMPDFGPPGQNDMPGQQEPIEQ